MTRRVGAQSPTTLLGIAHEHFDAMWNSMDRMKQLLTTTVADIYQTEAVEETVTTEFGRRCVGSLEVLKRWTHDLSDQFSESTEYVPRSWLNDSLEVVSSLKAALQNYGNATTPSGKTSLARAIALADQTLADPKWKPETDASLPVAR